MNIKQDENSMISFNARVVIVILSSLMLGVSTYLTYHYFEAHYPKGLNTSSLCTFTSIFSCDSAAFSPLSNIYKVPISVFGGVVSLFFLIGTALRLEKIDRTNSFLVRFVAAGSLLLMIYSVGILGTLCPFCTVFQIASFVLFYIFFKQIDSTRPDRNIIAVYSVVIVIVGIFFRFQIHTMDRDIEKMVPTLMKEYDSYPNLGNPQIASPYFIEKSTDVFTDAPIQIAIFSDFQCPPCQRLSELASKIATRYHGKINIAYYFYPLDSACNSAVSTPMHPLACKVAYLASCLKDDFVKTHDEIFHNQQDLTNEWIIDYATKRGVSDCITSAETREKVLAVVKGADQYNIRSTPTWILNGVKIEGVFPLQVIYTIIDELLKRKSAQPLPAKNE